MDGSGFVVRAVLAMVRPHENEAERRRHVASCIATARLLADEVAQMLGETAEGLRADHLEAERLRTRVAELEAERDAAFVRATGAAWKGTRR